MGPRVLCISSEVRDGDDVVVSVADTGTGIASQDIQRVFNPLFTTKSGGMGLGLSICRSIIEGHHGRLAVVPNIPKGAIFEIALRANMAGRPGYGSLKPGLRLDALATNRGLKDALRDADRPGGDF